MITESSVLALLILVLAGIACAVDITPNEIMHHENLALNVIDNNNLQSGLLGAFISGIEDIIKALFNGTTADNTTVVDTTNSNITVTDPSNSNISVSDPTYCNTTVDNITYGGGS